MILDIYKDAFEYGGQDFNSLLKLGLFSTLSFLILPIFLVLGYEYRIIENAIGGMIGANDALPKFNDLISMFIDGVKVFVVEFIYMIIPVIIGLCLIIIGNTLNQYWLNTLGVIIGFILLAISFIYGALAVPNMIAKKSFKKAFDFNQISNIIKNIGVFKYILFYVGLIVIMVVIYFVIGLLLTGVLALFGVTTAYVSMAGTSIIFIVGSVVISLIFSFIIIPYFTIFQSRALGLIYVLGD